MGLPTFAVKTDQVSEVLRTDDRSDACAVTRQMPLDWRRRDGGELLISYPLYLSVNTHNGARDQGEVRWK